jgi:hypothetical protein
MKSFWRNLKEAGDKVVSWFKKLLMKNSEMYKKYAPIAINIVNWIKEFNESENADLIETICTNLTGKYGAAALPVVTIVRKWLKAHLGEVLDGLKLGEAVANADTVEAKAKAAQAYIAQMGISDKTYAWTVLTSKIADALSDGRFSANEIIAIVICAYDTYKNAEKTLN